MRWISLAKQAPRCWRTEGGGEFFFFDALLGKCMREPVGGFANVEGDGSGVGGDHATGCVAVSVRPGGVGRDAAPTNGTGEAEGVEPAGIVVGDAGRQECALPLDGGSLKAFELAEGFDIVLVNGRIARDEGVFTAVRAGVVLKR